ncbi:MAG TPA: hypothetical protein VFS43_08405 [Polyangiaceae bacterium]|nr:hypothetical protein [Polyangiaceae bacterium]
MVRSVGLAAVVAMAVGCGQPPPPPATPAPAGAGGEAAGPVAPVAAGDGGAAPVGPEGEWGIVEGGGDYGRVVDKVATMVADRSVQAGAARRGLSLVNVTWEDTGRAEGSALGPNISDLTLQVRRRDPQGGFLTALMPVIRFPNFSDRTGDVPADKFFVRVGNERPGAPLASVPLTEVLRDLRRFASVPASIRGSGDLLAPRDTHFLVSAQAVFLPIPKEGKAEFTPAIFNYQSAPGSPAVLTLLVTREGTSVAVIENRPEDRTQGMGQEVYFNHRGQRASFTAERKSDVEARIAAQGGPKTESDRTALQKGADVLFLVQVPLVHAHRGALGGAIPVPKKSKGAPPMAPAPPKAEAAADDEGRSDVEQAVLGHGPNLGPYNEGRNLRLVRDPKFPIRITVQFYKATSNGVVSENDLDGIARSIGGVYEHADAVGSLVMPEGDPRRPTAWQSIPREWFPW